MRDIDTVSGYLKRLADNGVAVLWRPLHEAAGGWFWWGKWSRHVDGMPELPPDQAARASRNAAKACRALWIKMFDKMVNEHGLDNLIWVWTCEEGATALDWYPGDEYVDIIGRDYYPYPNQRERIHERSLVENFNNLKSIYNARKIIGLSENGSIPYPEPLIADSAHWSFFMGWYGDFAMGSANNEGDWDHVMNHPYVITLEDMPGWDAYTLDVTSLRGDGDIKARPTANPAITARARKGSLELNIRGMTAQKVELFNLRGAKIATLSKDRLNEGAHRFALNGRVARQMAIVKVTSIDNRVMTRQIRIE